MFIVGHVSLKYAQLRAENILNISEQKYRASTHEVIVIITLIIISYQKHSTQAYYASRRFQSSTEGTIAVYNKAFMLTSIVGISIFR